MTFTYKCRATRQKLSASFRIFGGFVKIIMGNSSSLIILTFTVAYYHNLHLVSLLQFKQFPELISFVLFRVARLDTTSITVHLLAGFSQEMAGLIQVKKPGEELGCISITSVFVVGTTAAVDKKMDFSIRQAWV